MWKLKHTRNIKYYPKSEDKKLWEHYLHYQSTYMQREISIEPQTTKRDNTQLILTFYTNLPPRYSPI